MEHKPIQVLQGNINHCTAAQDLVSQTMKEWSIDLAVLAEPYAIPDRRDWMGDRDGVVAICCPYNRTSPPPPQRHRSTEETGMWHASGKVSR